MILWSDFVSVQTSINCSILNMFSGVLEWLVWFTLIRVSVHIVFPRVGTFKHFVCDMWKQMPTRCNRRFLLQTILLAQHVSGTIMPIIRSSRVLHGWLLPVVFGALVFKLSVWCGAEGYVSGLRAAAACWASNMVCNKNRLLHLVGIYFHILTTMHGQNHIKFTSSVSWNV